MAKSVNALTSRKGVSDKQTWVSRREHTVKQIECPCQSLAMKRPGKGAQSGKRRRRQRPAHRCRNADRECRGVQLMVACQYQGTTDDVRGSPIQLPGCCDALIDQPGRLSPK